MPKIFRMGEYWIYFWTNESKPLEPIHVHIAKGSPTANSTKIWITSTGKCLLCNNQFSYSFSYFKKYYAYD